MTSSLLDLMSLGDHRAVYTRKKRNYWLSMMMMLRRTHDDAGRRLGASHSHQPFSWLGAITLPYSADQNQVTRFSLSHSLIHAGYFSGWRSIWVNLIVRVCTHRYKHQFSLTEEVLGAFFNACYIWHCLRRRILYSFSCTFSLPSLVRFFFVFNILRDRERERILIWARTCIVCMCCGG